MEETAFLSSTLESNTETESDTAEGTSSPPQQPKRRKEDWREVERFATKQDWRRSWEDGGVYVKDYRRDNNDGMKVFYRCKFTRKRGWHPCPCKRCVLFQPDGQVIEFWNGEEHDHRSILLQLPSNPLQNPEVRATVDEAVEDGLKPEGIIRKLQRKHLPLPSKKQLFNRISYLKRKRGGVQGVASTGTLVEWVRNLGAPTSPDAPLVIGQHQENLPGADGIPRFQVTLSSNRLVQLLEKAAAWPLHVDGTYKLVCQGFPVLMAGLTDANHAFHPIAISIVSHEDKGAYVGLLKSLKAAYHEHTNCQLAPRFVLADASPAITSAIRDVFQGCQRAMCWAHVIRNIDKKLKSVPQQQRGPFRNDLLVLQCATTSVEFTNGWQLLKRYYSSQADLLPILEYIETNWICSDTANWFEGFMPGYPSTNNGLERANRTLKDDYTLHVKLGMAQFLKKMEEAVSSWSLKEGRDSFKEEKEYCLRDWTDAWQWHAANPPRLRVLAQTSPEAYLVPAQQHHQEFAANCTAYLRHTQQGFNAWTDYRFHRESVWLVARHSGGWLCSCPVGVKHGCCKHTLGMAIKCGDVVAPDEAKSVPLGHRRKRGRPRRVLAPLERDDGEDQ